MRMQGSEVSGESVEQTLGDPAAKCVPRDEGYSVAATRKRRPRLARQPVDFKHGEGMWLTKEPFDETPNGAKPGFPTH